MPAALLKDLDAKTGPAGVVAADQGDKVDPRRAQGIVGRNAEDPDRVVVPEHDQTRRIDDCQSGPELPEQP